MVEGDKAFKDFPLERCSLCKKETRILFPFKMINIDRRASSMDVIEYVKNQEGKEEEGKLCLRCNPITVKLGLTTEDSIMNMTEEQKAGMINYSPQIAHLNAKKVQSVAYDLGKGILDIPKRARISATEVLASGVAMGHKVRARVKIGGREKILTGNITQINKTNTITVNLINYYT